MAFLGLGALAQPGSWDTSFGDNGKVLVPSLGGGNDDQTVTAVVLPDDRILVAGRSSDGDHYNTVLLRLSPDGSSDLAYGTDGVVQHDLAAGSEFIRSAELDGQGRLVVGGHLFSDAAENNSDMFVARFLADGSLDPSFNGTGILVRDIHNTPDAEEAYEVLVQPDGRIVLCGFSGAATGLTEVVLERYLDNGDLDPTFGGDGSVLVSIGDASGEELRSAVLGDAGDIYFCGLATRTGESDLSLLLGHLDAAGNIPTDFGNASGHSWISEEGADLIARSIALQPDGNMVVAGVKRPTGGSQGRIIHQFDPNGLELADAFQNSAEGADAWNCLLVQNNGAILGGGNVADGPDSRNWNVQRWDAELNGDGTFITTDYDEDGGEETCFDLAFTNDSSVLGIGYAEVAGLNHIVLIKYRNDISSTIEEGSTYGTLSVAPNPVSERTTLTLSNGASTVVDLLLSDPTGRTVRRWSQPLGQGGRLDITLDDLAIGTYSLRVGNAGHYSTVKVVKQ